MINLQSILIITALLSFSTHAATEIINDDYAQATLAISEKNFAQAETHLINHFQRNPEDIEARFQLARVLSWQQKWPEAMKHFDELLKENPNNADYLLARANTLEWMGNHKEALQVLKNARQVSPEYSEIWRTEIAYLRKQNSPSANDQIITLIDEAKLKFPEENWDYLPIVRRVKVVERNGYAIEDSFGYDKLTNDRSAWETKSVKLFMQTTNKEFAHLQLDRIERFDLDDWQIGVSYALPFAHSWYYYIGTTYSPTHKVIANWMLDTKISRSFTDGINLHVGVSHAKYTETDSQQLYLTGEYYWSTFRAAYTYRLIDVKNAGTGDNHNIQINRYYDSTSFIGATIAKGKDVEFDGTADPPISDVLTLSIYGSHTIMPQWSLIYSFTYHEQGDFYNRNGFVLGVKFDF